MGYDMCIVTSRRISNVLAGASYNGIDCETDGIK